MRPQQQPAVQSCFAPHSEQNTAPSSSGRLHCRHTTGEEATAETGTCSGAGACTFGTGGAAGGLTTASGVGGVFGTCTGRRRTNSVWGGRRSQLGNWVANRPSPCAELAKSGCAGCPAPAISFSIGRRSMFVTPSRHDCAGLFRAVQDVLWGAQCRKKRQHLICLTVLSRNLATQVRQFGEQGLQDSRCVVALLL